MNRYENRIERAVRFITGSRRVAAFTGAGISTESGISDFRSPGGIWERYRIVTYQEFLASREKRMEYWKMKSALFRELRGAKPNKAHLALAGLERLGRLHCLVTQNIDGLHQDAGSAGAIEIHGTNRQAVCVACGKRRPIEHAQAIVEAGDFDPRCDGCGGFLKPATVSFGQAMPEEAMREAFSCAGRCDVLLMVGSSLRVEPAASIPREAKRAGARLIFINRTETPWDGIADLLFRESAGEVVSEIATRVPPAA